MQPGATNATLGVMPRAAFDPATNFACRASDKVSAPTLALCLLKLMASGLDKRSLPYRERFNILFTIR